MERNKHSLITPAVLFAVFVLYTAAVALIDVKPVGQMNSNVGMATINKALSENREDISD